HPAHRPLHSFPTRRSSDLAPLSEDRLDRPEVEHHGQYSDRHDDQAAFLRAEIQFVQQRPHSMSLALRLQVKLQVVLLAPGAVWLDRKSTRLNSSHVAISYA